MARNFTPGWNDPPQISAGGLDHCRHGNSRSLFRNHSYYQNFPGDLANYSASDRGNVLIASHSAADISGLGNFTPPLSAMTMTVGSAMAGSSSSLPSENSIPELNNSQILEILENQLSAIPSLSNFCKEGIRRRIDRLSEVLNSQSLTDECRKKLCLLVTELSNHQYVNAYNVQGNLMVDHFSEAEEDYWIQCNGSYEQQEAKLIEAAEFKRMPSKPKLVNSSKEWFLRHIRDPYVRRAQLNHYRARSAFKLIEIDDRFHFLKPGMFVVDCGAAPGSWTQVIAKRVNCGGVEANRPIGFTIAIDKASMEPISDVIVLQNTDMLDPEITDLVDVHLQGRKLDAVVSDMAPNATGNHQLDHERILKLDYLALSFAVRMLKRQQGIFLCKLWTGSDLNQFCTVVKKFFSEVHIIKPLSSRKDSSELYIFGKGFKHSENIYF
ncbi:unnamed protein product [Soboliphyme baturini]|uniref:rRNA methyltransferase 2, mitochondrial n=1 Tax=Soboliphyme baturini TaxID=241478 RepID=A0A183J4T5_9BILA|nr:unnamed protein product [Soboliphyme baturini]